MLKIATERHKHLIEYMGAKFTVVPCTPDETLEILKQNTYTHKVETPIGKSDKYEERIHWPGVHADKMDAQVVAWEGIDGNLPCTSENKRMLASLKDNEHICLFLQQEIANVGQAKEEAEKEKRGN